MDPLQLSILCAAAFLTSVLSAVVGLAGGITLLAVMLLFLPPLVAIPVHGAIQLVANASRAWFQRRHVRWGILARYAILLAPAGVAGLAIVKSLPTAWLRGLIGAFVLVATWAPGRLLMGTHPERADPDRRFVWLGGVAGLLNMGVGATGPLIAPFFLGLGLSRQATVGTMAACQALGHGVKIALFGAWGFGFRPWLATLVLLAAMVVAGSWTGTRLLDRVSERGFVWLYKGVLTLIALRLLLGELAAWIELR